MTLDLGTSTPAGRAAHVEWLRGKAPHIIDPEEFDNMDGRTLEWLTSSLCDFFDGMAELEENLAEMKHLYDNAKRKLDKARR